MGHNVGMDSTLFAWLGFTDLEKMRAATSGQRQAALGPIGEAVSQRTFAAVEILSDLGEQENRHYAKWLGGIANASVTIHPCRLRDPNDFTAIYKHATNVVGSAESSSTSPLARTYHLSPGTSTMGAVWVILAKTRFPAELIECSRQDAKTGRYPVRTVSVPFEMSAEYVEDLLRKPDEDLLRLSQGLPVEPAFEAIVHRSTAMKRVIGDARRLAPRSIPVLILGETGTGKELLAKAMHSASPRRDRPFKAVNCGAIPEHLVESELFGHKKGAFTDARRDREGAFSSAHGGTLFLDEVAELPRTAQVKLLRVLEDGVVVPVGADGGRQVDVRVIAATNRNLMAEVGAGAFREDLFYRLAVGIIKVPPIREREGDIGLLIDYFIKRLNQAFSTQPGFVSRTLSPGARNRLLSHSWPGNVRELENTLMRALDHASGSRVSAEDIDRAIVVIGQQAQSSVLDRALGADLSIEAIVAEVARHYLERAWRESGGNKSRAARLLGLRSHQTFENWAKRYGTVVHMPPRQTPESSG